ncbi:MAG: protease modulator HflK N-terminal domain-containing protein, partial [Quisquiliibacterium sp.]
MIRHLIGRIFSINDPGWGRGQSNGGGGNNSGPQRPNNDGPPDLDELWRDFNRRLNNVFGRRGGGGPPGGSSGQGPS